MKRTLVFLVSLVSSIVVCLALSPAPAQDIGALFSIISVECSKEGTLYTPRIEVANIGSEAYLCEVSITVKENQNSTDYLLEQKKTVDLATGDRKTITFYLRSKGPDYKSLYYYITVGNGIYAPDDGASGVWKF